MWLLTRVSTFIKRELYLLTVLESRQRLRMRRTSLLAIPFPAGFTRSDRLRLKAAYNSLL